MSRKVRRRDVLKGIGAAGIAGIAGCSGDGGDGGGTTAGGGDGDGGSTPTPEPSGETTTEAMDGGTTTMAGTTATGGRTIKLGLLMGVTGGLKKLGPPIRQAAELAVKHVNEADTAFSVDTQFEDTGTKPNQGVSGGEALVNAGYPMLCGALSSSVSLQVAKNVAIPNGVTQCSPASTSPKFTTLEDNGFFWRTAATDALQGALLARIAAKRLGHDSAATLYLNNAYGNGLNQGFADAFKNNHNGTVTAQVSFAKGQSSYTSQLNKALEGDPGVLLVVGYPASGVQIFKDFYSEFDRGDMDILVSDGLKDSTLPGSVGFDMTNVKGTAPAGTGPGAEFFTKEYKDAYGESIGAFTKQSYDAAAILMLANAAAGANDGRKVRDNMKAVANPEGKKVTPGQLPSAIEMVASGTEINYQGVFGPVAFDDVGDLSGAVYSYYEFTKDGLKEVETISYSA